jgi:3-hydroxyacyl-[acyl-carrier-protein] dehydratase
MNQAIIEYIPQRAPMIMVDALQQVTDKTATSTFCIQPDNIFVTDGKFTEPGLLENIAQTAAAMAGHQSALKKIPAPIGYLAAIKDLKIFSLPTVQAKIETTVNLTNTVLDVTIVEGTVRQNEKLLCSCEMRILIQKSA